MLDIEIVERRTGGLASIGTSRNTDIVVQEATAKAQAMLKILEDNETLRAQNRALEDRIAEFEAAQAKPAAVSDTGEEYVRRIAELEARIAELEATQATPAAVSYTGEEYVAWVEFEAAAVQAFSREGSWKSVFAFEAEMDVKTLNGWQTVGCHSGQVHHLGEDPDRRPESHVQPQKVVRRRIC